MSDQLLIIPRELTQMAADAIDDLLADGVSAISAATWADVSQQLSAILAKPAEQHQGEPVAYQWRCKTVHVDSQWRHWVDCTEEDYLKTIDNPGPTSRGVIREARKLYTHADPGEVERLKSTAEHFTGVSIKAADEVSRLRAKLIELESSVREFLRIDGLSVDGSAARNKALKMLAATLSASAEPSAPKYPRVEIVRAHKHTCASCKEGDGFGPCDCGAIVDGVAVRAEPSAPVERDDLMELLRDMTYAYRGAIQAGYDRITSLGGDCDSVDKMLADFPAYAKARAALDSKPS